MLAKALAVLAVCLVIFAHPAAAHEVGDWHSIRNYSTHNWDVWFRPQGWEENLLANKNDLGPYTNRSSLTVTGSVNLPPGGITYLYSTCMGPGQNIALYGFYGTDPNHRYPNPVNRQLPVCAGVNDFIKTYTINNTGTQIITSFNLYFN
jgi:hypothetical protein